MEKVFFSLKDPDIRSFDRSSAKLKKNKILIHKNLLSDDVRKFYMSYYKFKKSTLPFVTAKIAMSKNYFTAYKTKWITNLRSRGRVHLMRSYHDCIITSSETIICDNPEFTCRIPGLEDSSPSLIILDKNLRIPIKSKIIKLAKKRETIIFYNKINKRKITFAY